jgi:signal recognition particle subunit SEC65
LEALKGIFRGSHNGNKKTYSADCYIQRPENSQNRDALVEVKYTTELEKKKEYLEKKFKAIKEVTDELDLDFIVFTEEVYPEDYIENLNFLYRYKTQGREIKYDEIIKEKLQDKKLSADELANDIAANKSEYIIVSNAIWGLVAESILKTDLMSSKVNMKSIVELNDGSC